MSKQQRVKVLLQALDQLPVDFLVLQLWTVRAASLPGGVHSPLSQIASQKRYGVKNTEQEMQGTRGGSGHGGPHSRTGQTQTRGREGEEEKEAKTVAAQTASSSSHAARRRTRTHARTRTYVHTNTHNSSFLDEATPKTEEWFMRRSRPMGIRVRWGIRL